MADSKDFKRYMSILKEHFDEKVELIAEQHGDIQKNIQDIKEVLQGHTEILQNQSKILQSHSKILQNQSKIFWFGLKNIAIANLCK